MTGFDSLFGLELIADPFMATNKQFRFPKSKGRRIRRKWSKRPCNWRLVPDRTVYQYYRTIIAHPVMIEEIKALYKQKESKP